MFSYFCLFSILFVILILILITINYIDKFRISSMIKDFTSYLTLLEYHMKKAYDIVYKDRILIYSLESTKINDDEFNVASKEFALLVLKLIGPNLENVLIEFYGNEETLIFNLIEYFNTNFEGDQIREQSKQNLYTSLEESNFNGI